MTFKGHICTHIYTEVAEHDSPNSQLPQAEHSHTLSPQQAPADPKDPPRAATEICRGKLPVEAGTVQGFSLKKQKNPLPLLSTAGAQQSCPCQLPCGTSQAHLPFSLITAPSWLSPCSHLWGSGRNKNRLSETDRAPAPRSTLQTAHQCCGLSYPA